MSSDTRWTPSISNQLASSSTWKKLSDSEDSNTCRKSFKTFFRQERLKVCSLTYSSFCLKESLQNLVMSASSSQGQVGPNVNPNSTAEKPVFCGGAKTEDTSFIWKIENFEMMCKSMELVTPQKVAFEFGNKIVIPTKWQLCLCIEADKEENRNYISGLLTLVRKPQHKDVIISLEVTVKGSNDESLLIKKEHPCNMSGFCGRSEGLGFRIVEQDAKFEELHMLDKDGTLLMEVNLTLFYTANPRGQNVYEKFAEFEKKSMRKLSQDLAKIGEVTGTLQSTNSSNVGTYIISKDDFEVESNRGVLAARSDVFLRMFQTEMMEAATGVVVLEDVTSKTMDVLLHYMLTGFLLDSWREPNILPELAYAAHKYELNVLSEFLDGALGSFCTKTNSKDLLVLAKKLNMKRAEKAISDFIMNNAETLDDLALDYEKE